MATIIHKTINGHGPYAYKVTYEGGKHHWTYLGRAGAVDAAPGPVTNDATGAGGGINVTNVDDPAAKQLATDINDEDTYTEFVEEIADAGGKAFDRDKGMPALLNLMDTDDPELADAIDTIQHERRSTGLASRRTTEYLPASEDEIHDALDTIEEKTGVRPAELDASGHSLELTNTDIKMPTDPDAAADLVNGVVNTITDRFNADEPGNQASAQAAYERVLGEDTVREAKNSVNDPDALGFAHPDDIPARAGEDGKTPVTDLYGVGPATANEAHPDGENLALEDYGELSGMQRERVRVDVDVTEHPDKFAATTRRVVDRAGDPTTALIGALQMRDPDIEEFHAQDQAGVLGVAPAGEDWGVVDSADLADVTNVEVNEDVVEMEDENGDTSRYSLDYWNVIAPVVDEYGTGEIRKGEGAHPAEIELENGDSIVLAPRIEDE